MKFMPSICAGAAVATAAFLITARPASAQDAPGKTAAPSSTSSMSEFSIDPTHSMALFRVRHFGAGAFWGRFSTVSGTIKHDPSKKTGLRVDVVIAIASIDTGSSQLDEHVKTSDFFNVEKFPTATFKSTSAKLIGDRMYEVQGELTMHGVSKNITANVEWLGTLAGRRGERCGFETTFTVKRSEFGMSYGVAQGVLGDETRIVVAIEAVKRPKGEQGGPRGDRRRNMMGRFDTNGDGKIQKEDLPERMRSRFDELDADGDGALTAEELMAMRRGGNRPPSDPVSGQSD